MPQVDFYVLDANGGDAVLRVACRVVEKAWRLGLRVHVLAHDEEQARRMDDTLWTFRQDSFVPHEHWRGAGTPGARVTVGAGSTAPGEPDMLVNLGAAVPRWYAACARVAEIVGGAPEARAASRDRYRLYRDAGLTLETHEVRA